MQKATQEKIIITLTDECRMLVRPILGRYYLLNLPRVIAAYCVAPTVDLEQLKQIAIRAFVRKTGRRAPSQFSLVLKCTQAKIPMRFQVIQSGQCDEKKAIITTIHDYKNKANSIKCYFQPVSSNKRTFKTSQHNIKRFKL